MKAAIVNPYLDTLGGGERYTAMVAKTLLESGYKVNIEWSDPGIIKKLEERFGLDLKGLSIVKDVERGESYDICFWVSDGSIPALKARKNVLHFQVPFHGVGGTSLMNKFKLARVNKVVCNSYFTKNVIDSEYGVESVVVYPPVATDKITPKRKQNIILSVGRFSQLKQAKRQDVLVRSFKSLYDQGFKEWRLILAGGVEVGVGNFLKELKKEAKGYPIEIVESASFEKLLQLYGKAKIFWSAAGFGVNEEKNPEAVEHFGITVVEAMAAGAVPVVFRAGGHKEIVSKGETGFLWSEEKSLINYTKKLVEEKGLLTEMSKRSQKSSLVYEQRRFVKEFEEILN